MIAVYYNFVLLSDEVRTANRIKSQARLDCISFADMVAGGYNGLTFFVNQKRFKGQLFFYKTNARDFVSSDSKRLAEWSLTNDGLNFSSIYIEDLDSPEFGYGYPNANRTLKNGQPNPLFPFRNDGYLFIINKDYTQIEVFIIPDGRNLITSYYQKMIDGGFDDEVRELREKASPFYRYDGLVL